MYRIPAKVDSYKEIEGGRTIIKFVLTDNPWSRQRKLEGDFSSSGGDRCRTKLWSLIILRSPFY